MPLALIAIATILGIEIICRRYNKRSQTKHQKRQAFDEMMASADNEQARADIETRRRKIEERKRKRKERAGGSRKRARIAGRVMGRKGKEGRTRSNRVMGSDGYDVVDVTREWEERYKTKMDSWDFGGSEEW